LCYQYGRYRYRCYSKAKEGRKEKKCYQLKRQLEKQEQASIASETELAKKKRRKSEYNKQYRLKRKMNMQQSDIELEITRIIPIL
jgi:hypothetical protein